MVVKMHNANQGRQRRHGSQGAMAFCLFAETTAMDSAIKMTNDQYFVIHNVLSYDVNTLVTPVPRIQ